MECCDDAFFQNYFLSLIVRISNVVLNLRKQLSILQIIDPGDDLTDVFTLTYIFYIL